MELRQPPLRPPPYVFGPVWTALYATMGYAAYRAWTAGVDSFDPAKLMLAKVNALKSIEKFVIEYLLQTNLTIARSYSVFNSTRPESCLDAPLLRPGATHRSYG
jgi:tryptophan-rich sensory protein